MALSKGCHHIAIVTGDLDRLIAFYGRIFGAELRLDQDEGAVRHAMIDLGNGFCLHPFEFREQNSESRAVPAMFARGHVDHFAIDMPDRASFDEVRRRLVAERASEGCIRDFGMADVTGFTDPDGMECEIALWKDGPALTLGESSVSDMSSV